MNDNATFNTTFDSAETFNTSFQAEETFDTEMTEIVEIVTSDHRELNHRDAENQHPIGSISNLQTELQNRVVSGNALTNMEIDQILGF